MRLVEMAIECERVLGVTVCVHVTGYMRERYISRDRRLCVLPGWQMNVNVNVNVKQQAASFFASSPSGFCRRLLPRQPQPPPQPPPLPRRDAIPLATARLPHATARSPREASHLRGAQAHPGGSWPGAAERAVPCVYKTRARRPGAQISRHSPRRDFAPGIAGSLSQLGDVRL